MTSVERQVSKGTTGLILVAVGAALAAGGCGGDAIPEKTQQLVILHTSDIHSRLMGESPEGDYTPTATGNDATRGGIARLAAAIGTTRAAVAADKTPVLLLDGGDFMMGSLFELLGTSAAAELTLMQSLGYDATTIGNHELDWTPQGLAGILQAAVAGGLKFPIIASNMNFDPNDPGDDSLKALADAGFIQTKLVKMVGNLKVGIFGLLGKDAQDVTPQKAPLTFDPIADAAARMVTELRQTDKVDLVIALSHSGIDATGVGEDAILANAVPGIDVIISGHSHDTLAAPAKIGGALIVTAGAYGKYLGKLQLSVTKGAKPGDAATVAVDGYTLLDIDDKIEGDAATQTKVDTYISGIDQALSAGGLSYKQLVGQTTVDLPFPAHVEAPVGNLVTDAYRSVSAALQPTDPPVIGIEGNGQIRSDLAKGTTGRIWFADLFRVVPNGIGPDQHPGYPLVAFYLNAKDISSGLELDAAQDVFSNDFFLQVSGLTVAYDMSKPAFTRVTSVKLTTSSGTQTLDPTDTATCYKIVTTNYVAGLLGVVSSATGGALEVMAKDADCKTPVDPTTRFVDADPTTDGVQELKNWQALLKYVSGLGQVPAAYATSQGRIVAR